MDKEKASDIYNVSDDYMHHLSNDDLLRAIASNLNYIRNDEARLSIQIPEALRRGLIIGAEAIKYARLDSE